MVSSLQVVRVDEAGPVSAAIDAPWWRAATRSPRFVDMVTGRPAIYDSWVACLAAPSGLRFLFWSEDPYPTATKTERDEIVFADNDVELFVDFGWGYYELEVNAFGTIYEVMHVWRDTWSDSPFVDDSEFTIDQPGVFTFGGDFDRRPESFWHGTHPRGVRISHIGYDVPGIEVAVVVDGRLNDPSVTSRGWSVEIELPWTELERLSQGRISATAPSWDIGAFLGRFQHLDIGGVRHTAAWCVSPHGVMDTHQPERFTRLQFGAEPNMR